MVVKTSKVMYNELKKALKNDDRTKDYKLIYNQMDSRQYGLYIGYYNMHEYLDFNERNGKYNIITVVYPDNCYASDHHISSELLVECYNNSDKTFKGFIDKVIDYIEI